MNNNEILLNVKGLQKIFPVYKGVFNRKIGDLKAVNDIDLFIRKGETLGLVGESGCGKTTAGRTILHLLEPSAGKIYFKSDLLTGGGENGMVDISHLTTKALKNIRREMQIIFQDPYSSLDPRMSVGRIIGEPLFAHGLANGSEKEDKVRELLISVGLKAEHMNRYPHEFSGGQRQRISIARALAPGPSVISPVYTFFFLAASVFEFLLGLFP